MNAAMLVTGLARGGRAGAKKLLEEFWTKIVESAAGPQSPFSMFALEPHPELLRSFYENSPAYLWGEWITKTFSPYQLNPLNVNPLRELLEELIDFDEVGSMNWPTLFVNATNVQKGKPHILLGWRVYGEPCDLSLDLRCGDPRRCDCAHQSDCAR